MKVLTDQQWEKRLNRELAADKKKYEVRVKKGLEVVTGKIVTKRGLFRIRKPVRDFLADNRLIPTSEEEIGRGMGSSFSS